MVVAGSINMTALRSVNAPENQKDNHHSHNSFYIADLLQKTLYVVEGYMVALDKRSERIFKFCSLYHTYLLIGMTLYACAGFNIAHRSN